MRAANDPQHDQVNLLAAAAQLWILGAKIDWQAFHQNETRHRVLLSTYHLSANAIGLTPVTNAPQSARACRTGSTFRPGREPFPAERQATRPRWLQNRSRASFRQPIYSSYWMKSSASRGAHHASGYRWGACEVVDTDRIDPAKALIPAACRVIPREYPHVRLPVCGISTGRKLTRRFIAGWRAHCDPRPPSVDSGVQPLPLPASGTRVTIREQGVYLITGGFGSAGLALARHLASTAKAKLVLISRSASQNRDEVHSLEEAGAEFWRSPPMSPIRSHARSDRAAKARFGAIHGVIHAAGIGVAALLRIRP